MPYGGSTYSLPAGSLVTDGTTADAADHNTPLQDIETALNAVIKRDGAAAFSASQSMGSNTLTNLGVSTTGTSAARVDQIQGNALRQATAVGGTVDAITITMAPVTTAWTTGESGRFTATGANTSTTPTLNKDSIGVKTIVKWNGAALAPGDIIGSGHQVEWVYNGTNVVILNPATDGGTIYLPDAATNSTSLIATERHVTSGTAAVGFGSERRFTLENASGTEKDAAALKVKWTNATAAAEQTRVVIEAQTAGAAKAEIAAFEKNRFYLNAVEHWSSPLAKSADMSVTANTTLASDAHLTFAMEASKNYIIRGTAVLESLGSGGWKLAATGPAAPTLVNLGLIGGAFQTSYTTFETRLGGLGAGTKIADFAIYVENGANAGTFAIQFAQETSNGTASVLKKGSYIEWRER